MPTAVPPLPIARVTVEQYHRLIQSGAFTEHDQLELIDGKIARKAAKGPGHEYTTGELAARLERLTPPEMHLRNQAPITLEHSEPEPDLALVRGSRAAYRTHHPGASDVTLVIELSDTTLATDRIKAQTYAQAGILEYWIVNLVDRCIEVYSSPSTEHGYLQREVFSEAQAVDVPLASGAASIRVGDVLP